MSSFGINIFDLPRLPLKDELTTVLAQSDNVRIERIISTGQCSGWYDDAQSEFVLLLDGQAEIEYQNGDVIRLDKGGTVLIKPHEKHRVKSTTADPPCVWICVFFD